MDRQTKVWVVPDRWLPLTHKISMCRGHLSHRIRGFSVCGLEDAASRWNQMLSRCFMNCSFCLVFFLFSPPLFFFLQCHLLHIKLMSIGNNSSCQRGSGCASWTGRGLLSELSKSPHRLVRWLCVCQPTCPAFPPPSLHLLPSIHPPSLLPSAQGLIDQPCPGSCPQITQLDVFCVWVKWINYRAKSNGNRGARKSPLNATEERQRETGRNRGGRGGSRAKTDGREVRMKVVWRKHRGEHCGFQTTGLLPQTPQVALEKRMRKLVKLLRQNFKSFSFPVPRLRKEKKMHPWR